MARTKIERFLMAAREVGDIEKESEYAAQLAEVDSRLEEQKERSKKDSIESVNRRNWNKNISVLNTISTEVKAHRVGQTQAERNKAIAANPYVRRPTRPGTLWATRSEESQKRVESLKEEALQDGEAKKEESKPAAAGTQSPTRRSLSPSKRSNGNAAVANSPKLPASVHSSINVKWDIANMLAGVDDPAKSGAVTKPAKSATQSAAAASRTPNRKGMSLGEYWRRQTGLKQQLSGYCLLVLASGSVVLLLCYFVDDGD
jgi:hypothetical protein